MRASLLAPLAAVFRNVSPAHPSEGGEHGGAERFFATNILAEYAAELSRQSGKETVYNDIPAEAYRTVLTGAGVPEPMAEILVDVDTSAIRRGLMQGGSGELSRLIGRPTTPIADSIGTALKASE